MAEKKVAVVVGVGAGLGAALARRFASGYSVALVARSSVASDSVCDRRGPRRVGSASVRAADAGGF